MEVERKRNIEKEVGKIEYGSQLSEVLENSLNNKYSISKLMIRKYIP